MKKIDYDLLKEGMEKILDSLTEREADVLRERFGFNGEQKTLQEIGDEYNLTKDRIRQIEAKAIRKLRHPTRTRVVKSFYFD